MNSAQTLINLIIKIYVLPQKLPAHSHLLFLTKIQEGEWEEEE